MIWIGIIILILAILWAIVTPSAEKRRRDDEEYCEWCRREKEREQKETQSMDKGE